jgi:hypothetical protein
LSYSLSFLLQFLPLPSIAGFYLARFFTKKSLPSYFSFVVLGSLMVTWFVMHNFWDLNIWLAGMSLKSFCKLIIANFVLAMAVPGLAVLPSKLHFLTEVGLISHALLLCYIENRFFNYSSIYYYGFEDEVMYPSDGLLLGFCILSAGLACVPIVAIHFSHVLVGKPFFYKFVVSIILLLFTGKGGFARAKLLVQLNMFHSPFRFIWDLYRVLHRHHLLYC